jgi:hypothetical protein
MPDWPRNIPFMDDPDSFAETGPLENVIRSQRDKGPSKTRRRFTAAVREITGRSGIMGYDQLQGFETFYRDEIGDGSLSFTARHPRTHEVATFKFVGGYQVIPLPDEQVRIAMKLEILP